MSRKNTFALFADPRFLAIVGCGSVAVILCALLAPPAVQIAVIGFLLLILLGCFLTSPGEVSRVTSAEPLETAIALARKPRLFDVYQSAGQVLVEISENSDPLFQELAAQRCQELVSELAAIGKGRIVYTGTETWRMTYAQLLRSPGLHLYRSIAYLKTSNYWQNEPGRQSSQLNYEMINKGTLRIERIAIIPDALWPTGERLPSPPLCDWLEEQHNHGIWLLLVRQSELAEDSDLVVDLGIYGNRAVGLHELDSNSRTVRFTLSFDFSEVLAAESRWERLSVYATSYREILDRSSGDL